MELELQKSKLKAEIEVFTTQRKELSDTLSDLRKCIMADKGDYGKNEAERIFRIEDLEEQVLKLSKELEIKQNDLSNSTQNNTNLVVSSQSLENKIQKLNKEKIELEKEFEKITKSLDQFKIFRQEEEEKRRVKLAVLRMDIEAETKKLNDIRIEYEQKRIHNLAEERRLSIKRSDLEIYEERMRRKYKDDTFVLKQWVQQ